LFYVINCIKLLTLSPISNHIVEFDQIWPTVNNCIKNNSYKINIFENPVTCRLLIIRDRLLHLIFAVHAFIMSMSNILNIMLCLR